jgi:hypothetical protein
MKVTDKFMLGQRVRAVAGTPADITLDDPKVVPTRNIGKVAGMESVQWSTSAGSAAGRQLDITWTFGNRK